MSIKRECPVFLKLRKDAQEFVARHENSAVLFEIQSGRPTETLINDIKAKLGIERRKARMGAPDYDSNRHINLLRIMKSIESRQAMPS